MNQPNPTQHPVYYVPDHSYWPIIGSLGLGAMVFGLVGIIHEVNTLDMLICFAGLATILFMVTGWFNHVIKESMGGLYSPQMDRSFRITMIWFIFSEAMFFAAFFGTLFFVRHLAVPWLSGAPGHYELTGQLLWPNFVAEWPLLKNPSPDIVGPQGTIPAMGIPLINTVILLTSGITVTWAHYALKKENRRALNLGLFLTVALGIIFLGFQIYEFFHAYNDLGLTLNSGVYGSTFFMLTGFHGLHVTLGTIMLTVILFRSLIGHFSPDHHFAFEATAWYWHFVDVVWIGLFIYVYLF